MGVDLALLRFFDHCAMQAALEGPMLALGSLTLRETEVSIEAFARANNYPELAQRLDVATLMRARYGIESYFSCDINGLADLDIDLSKPLNPVHRGAFRSVLNGGTLEHVFDLRQALENVHDATAEGGLMLHTCPVTWFDHGFVNLNPLLFHLLAEANAYDVIGEGFYFSAGAWPGQDQPFVALKQTDAEIFGAPYESVFRGRAIPANAMHLIALRKTRNTAFASPVQPAY